MSGVMPSTVLDVYLDDIKTIFYNFDFNKLKKMIFMNVDSFFHFIDDSATPGKSGKTFKEIIESIEDFIPLVINNENLDTYLLTAISRDEAEMERLQYKFTQNAKIRFVKNVFNAHSDDDLEEIFDVCRTIRDYKEKTGM